MASPRRPEDLLDPYFVLAKATRFADYLPPDEQHDKERQFAASVELRTETSRPELVLPFARGASAGSRFFTGTVTAAEFEALSADSRIARIQFAEPLAAPRAAKPRWTSSPSVTLLESTKSRSTRSKTLLGIVDNGCPFAHQALRRGASTRILSLWIQDSKARRGSLGRTPAHFGYGLEFRRDELDQMLSTATGASGSVDEDLCYRLAGYDQLLHRRTHGAHSLGLLAGPRRWRVQPGMLAGDIVAAPAALTLSSADIVFVQLPRTLMDCNSVAAVEHHAMNGFRHILDVAHANHYEELVISFGYESWIDAHDGTSWFDSALGDLLVEARKKLRAELFLAAGNSRIRHSHAAVSRQEGAVLQWHVPPGNEVPTFLEIWAPPDQDALRIQVTPPGRGPLPELHWGESYVTPRAEHAEVGIAMHRSTVLSKDHRVILVRVSPTHSWEGRATAPHGLWTVSIGGIKGADIHAHIGRVEGDSNSPRRTCQPMFVGRDQEEALDECRTLNGHACGNLARTCGVFYSKTFPYSDIPVESRSEGKPFRPAHDQPADYSSAGPAGGRQQPDVSLPMEDGLYHAGALSIATRSASVCRMKGTSTAAPAAARLFAEERLAFSKLPGYPLKELPPDPALGLQALDL